MTSYRDDLEAARSRIRVLESELEDREDEISALLGPNQAGARRDALRAQRSRQDGDGDYRSETLEHLRADDERHNSRLQLAACSGILIAIVALGVGTFYTILALMSYLVE